MCIRNRYLNLFFKKLYYGRGIFYFYAKTVGFNLLVSSKMNREARRNFFNNTRKVISLIEKEDTILFNIKFLITEIVKSRAFERYSYYVVSSPLCLPSFKRWRKTQREFYIFHFEIMKTQAPRPLLPNYTLFFSVCQNFHFHILQKLYILHCHFQPDVIPLIYKRSDMYELFRNEKRALGLLP